MNETDKFLRELPTNDQKIDALFEEPKTQEPEKESEEEGTENRQSRRLRQRLEAERESAKALNDRVKELSDKVSKYENVMSSEADERLTQIFGDDTPEKKALSKLFTDILKENKEVAKREALEAFESKADQEKKAVESESKKIDDEIDYLEETYGVDLTSDSSGAKKLRNSLIDMVEKLSPKDKDGNIIDYADFDATFQLIQAKPDPSRNKELGSRTMQNSKATDSSKDSSSALERYLNENGIKTRLR